MQQLMEYDGEGDCEIDDTDSEVDNDGMEITIKIVMIIVMGIILMIMKILLLLIIKLTIMIIMKIIIPTAIIT